MKTIVTGLASLALGLWSVLVAPGARADSGSYVQILSATVRDQKISGATVILQKNGAQSLSTSTGANGQAQVPTLGADDPSALLIVRKEGYSDLVAKCPCSGMTYAISPILERLDGMRIVLNWGRTPDDLDGHLGYETSHIFYINRNGDDAEQDIDHTDGFGPETITIRRKHAGTRYVYAVQDYLARRTPDSTTLSSSNAKVFVYVGQTLIRTYYVPTGKAGNLWTVFAVSEEGELQDINVLSGIYAHSTTQLTSKLVFGDYLYGWSQAPKVAAAAPSVVPDQALKLNRQGEAAYARADYPQATALFQQAIEQWPAYGQAYSNLGLVFKKTGRVAEALWANRKAIALASGPSAATTRASTHFNNGRIYEEARQWDDALREYESAVREKPISVYDNAIARVRRLGAQ